MSKLNSIGKFNYSDNSLSSNNISAISAKTENTKKPFIQINTGRNSEHSSSILGKAFNYFQRLGLALIGLDSPNEDAQKLLDKASRLQSLQNSEVTTEIPASESETDPLIDNWPASFIEQNDNGNQRVKAAGGLINNMQASNGIGENPIGAELNFSA